MANRKTAAGIVGSLFLLTLVAVYQENIAAWLEAKNLNTLLIDGGWLAIFPAVGHILVSPWLTHIYAFLAGMVAILVLMTVAQNSSSTTSDKQRKPNMTLCDVAAYLGQSQWAEEHPFRDDRLIERELLDYLASNHLPVFARPYSHHGASSPLQRIDADYFNYVAIDMSALRQGREDAIRPTPQSPQIQYVDFRVWRSDVEAIWPRPRVKRTTRRWPWSRVNT